MQLALLLSDWRVCSRSILNGTTGKEEVTSKSAFIEFPVCLDISGPKPIDIGVFGELVCI